jgi:hypothetical protein
MLDENFANPYFPGLSNRIETLLDLTTIDYDGSFFDLHNDYECAVRQIVVHLTCFIEADMK